MKRVFLLIVLAIGTLSLGVAAKSSANIVDIPPPYCPPFCR